MIGLMVERVTGAKSLQTYMETEIWGPSGIKEMTFFIHEREDLQKRMAAMCVRDEKSGKAVLKPPTHEELWRDAMGGGGIYATPAEYLKVLHAVLKNEGTLLKTKTVEDMFRPHLSAESHAALMKVLSVAEVNEMMGGMPPGTDCNWGLGGLLVMEDLKGWTKKGTMRWGGMPNLTWWIDMEAGICGLYAGQILPPGDSKSAQMSTMFEKTMYERFEQEKANLRDQAIPPGKAS